MPAEFDVRVWLCPWATEVSETEAPAITAPLLSDTTPRTDPLAVAACAHAVWQLVASNRQTTPLTNKSRNGCERPIGLLQSSGWELDCQQVGRRRTAASRLSNDLY